MNKREKSSTLLIDPKYPEYKEKVSNYIKSDIDKYVLLLKPFKLEKRIRINVNFSCEIFTRAFSDSELDGSNGCSKIIQPKGHDISPFLSYDTCFGNLGIHSEEEASKILPEIKIYVNKKKKLEKKIINKALKICKNIGYNKDQILDLLFDIVDEKIKNDN